LSANDRITLPSITHIDNACKVRPPAQRHASRFHHLDVNNTIVKNGDAVLPNINDGFAGQAPDIGAHELGAPLPVYGPQ
jgi:hypothetical protein